MATMTATNQHQQQQHYYATYPMGHSVGLAGSAGVQTYQQQQQQQQSYATGASQLQIQQQQQQHSHHQHHEQQVQVYHQQHHQLQQQHAVVGATMATMATNHTSQQQRTVSASTNSSATTAAALYTIEATKSTKGASKLRRDLINTEIAQLRELLPLPASTRQRLSQLQLMALVLVYVRKSNYFCNGKCLVSALHSLWLADDELRRWVQYWPAAAAAAAAQVGEI